MIEPDSRDDPKLKELIQVRWMMDIHSSSLTAGCVELQNIGTIQHVTSTLVVTSASFAFK